MKERPLLFNGNANPVGVVRVGQGGGGIVTPPAAELAERLQFALMGRWRWLRDDGRRRPEVVACISFAQDVGLLTAEQSELWQRRLDSCPGHDDEGGRSWCAYCGNMPREVC